jgi:hypothetical protein
LRSPWPARYLPAALLIAVALVVVPVTVETLRRQGRRQALLASAAALAALLVVAGGWREQRRYLENRYAQPASFARSGLDAVLPWVRHISDAEIATTAIRQYALAGPDLSNRVQFVGSPGAEGSFRQTRTCAEWWRALRRGGYDYLVTDLNRIRANGPRVPAPTAWTRLDPGATPVLSDPPATVFRIRDGGGPWVCGAHSSISPKHGVFERRESLERSEASES